MTAATLPQSRAQAFADKMMQMYNAGAMALMTSIGHRTGLFDAMAALPPATSTAIAKAARLNERYVREWLGAMVAGEVVDYDPIAQEYHLPREHAEQLTRNAAPNNLAATAQWIAVLGSVEDQIVEHFHKGGGVPYCSYHRFHEVMADESAQTVVAALFDHILPLEPSLMARLAQGIDVLDVGCGSGWALIELADRFPRSRFTGYDLSPEAIGKGRLKAVNLGLSNLKLEVRDVSDLGATDTFDLITAFDAIHDQADPEKVLTEIHEALRPGGLFLMQDIAGSSHVDQDKEHPLGAFLYTISCMHCMSVSLSQNGAGVGAMWGKEMACRMLRDAGFDRVEVQQLDHDLINYYYLAR